MIDDFRRGAEESYSPHVAPSQKHVMDDVGEISLDSSAPSDFANSDKGSVEAERARKTSSAGSARTNGGVVVTTTIKRESKPGPAVFEEMDIEDGYTAPKGSRPMSGRDGEFDSFSGGSRTKITGGKR